MKLHRLVVPLVLLAAFAWLASTSSEALQGRRARIEAALAEPFVGVTTDGEKVPDLFAVRSTGVSTAPVKTAAEKFLASLTDAQRKETHYPDENDIEWRKWDNVHRAPREGISFGEMSEAQRDSAFALFEASLSAKGLQRTKNVMKLNEYLAELIDKHGEYGEEFYFVTVMGEPSATKPWGWQLDGHHLVINYFVLGDQVVMSPTFMGSEPVIGEGKYAGIEVMQDEQDKGNALMESLDAAQQKKARLGETKERSNTLGAAYNDNLVLEQAGLAASEMNDAQKEKLRDVIREFVFNMSDDHAKIRMEEIEAHLDATTFAWVGTTGPEGVFYYRIQSPVLLIEFDHQGPIALEGPRVPSRRHVHSVMRTPNGNDYGKDLLRQHYEKHKNDPTHGHVH